MKKIISFFLLLIFSNFTKADIYRAKHDGFIKLISPEINKVLISHGLCNNNNDCRKKQLFFFAPGGKKLYISLYSITDLEIIRNIIDKIFLIYKKSNSSNSIKVDVYKNAHSKRGGFFKQIFSKNKPFLIILIKEK